MIKAGDRIVFKREKYGDFEVGVFVGERRVENAKRGEPRRMYTIELENGERIEVGYASEWTLEDAKNDMHHHIGWITVKEDFTHTDAGYECAAWYENIGVKKGSRYPLFTLEEDNERIKSVNTWVDGVVTSDDFGSRLCGVPISNYDHKKNAGKHSTHYISWYGYSFGSMVLAAKGDERYREDISKTYDIEVFDTFVVKADSFESEFGDEKRTLYTTSVSFARFDNLEDALAAELKDKEVDAELSFCNGEYQLEFVWGDWKEHVHADNVVREFFAARNIEVQKWEQETDTDGSDTYSSVHFYSEVK